MSFPENFKSFFQNFKTFVKNIKSFLENIKTFFMKLQVFFGHFCAKKYPRKQLVFGGILNDIYFVCVFFKRNNNPLNRSKRFVGWIALSFMRQTAWSGWTQINYLTMNFCVLLPTRTTYNPLVKLSATAPFTNCEV